MPVSNQYYSSAYIIEELFRPNLQCISGIVFQRMGEDDKAQQILDELIKSANQEYVSPYWLGALSIAVGEIDQGFSWLEIAYKDQDFWVLAIFLLVYLYLLHRPQYRRLRLWPNF